MLVYDITSRISFENLVEYRNQLLSAKGLAATKNTSRFAPMVLVGNNMDYVDNRQVSTEEGKTLANLFQCPYIETSSMTGLRIEEAFTHLVHAVPNLT